MCTWIKWLEIKHRVHTEDVRPVQAGVWVWCEAQCFFAVSSAWPAFHIDKHTARSRSGRRLLRADCNSACSPLGGRRESRTRYRWLKQLSTTELQIHVAGLLVQVSTNMSVWTWLIVECGTFQRSSKYFFPSNKVIYNSTITINT